MPTVQWTLGTLNIVHGPVGARCAEKVVISGTRCLGSILDPPLTSLMIFACFLNGIIGVMKVTS